MTSPDRQRQPQPDMLAEHSEAPRPAPLEAGSLPGLQPPDCPSREQVLRQLDPSPALFPRTQPRPSSPFRFQVWDLFAAMASVATGLAGAHWLSAELYAAIFGLLTLLGLGVFLLVAPPTSPWLQRACWCWVAAYFAAVFSAIVRS